MATNYATQAFDPDIGQLRGMLSQMGGLAEQAIHDSINALQRADTDLATRISRRGLVIPARVRSRS